MTVQEYEERFRSSIPSLHQTFVAAQGPNQARCRSRRFWVAAGLLGAVIMTCELSLHHAIQGERVTSRKYGTAASAVPLVRCSAGKR